MGDIYGVIQIAIQVLTPLVSDEISLHSGLQDDVKDIKCELESIAGFLMNAEERAEDDAAKVWVRQVRALAYDIEDVIERFQLFQKDTTIGRAISYWTLEVRDMSSTIKGLRETAISIARRRETYRFNGNIHYADLSTLSTSSLEYTSTMELDSDQVEDDIAKREIIDLLCLEDVNNVTSSTITVVGMTELGKTTVVASVYNDITVRSNFPLRAWISRSQLRQRVDILSSVFSQFCGAAYVRNIEKGSLRKELRAYLKDKRYIVVFDDVRESEIELASYIKKVLPFNNGGRKILMTTRYQNVAYAWLDGYTTGMYKLKPLSSKKAWELFCKKTFQSYGGRCPSPLKDLARGIASKCGGFPPAIISVSRLLSSKTNDISEWKKVHEGLVFFLNPNRQLSGIHKILMQSYYSLPFYLKPCLLYFGLFPKGYSIKRMRLIRLWIAEGFIIERRVNLTLEQVAEEYMIELINMSMIEVTSKDISGKIITLGVVSEFLHEMILLKLEELSFCRILSEKGYVGNKTSRRLSIHNNDSSSTLEVLKAIIEQKRSSIRSLCIVNVSPPILAKVLTKAFLTSINLLKVLDLFNAPVDFIPKEVGRLLNLHYLSLRGTRVSTLPGSIGKLENLQTLDLKQTFISELPKEFLELRRLRHLLGYRYQHDFCSEAQCMKIYGIKIPEGLLGNYLKLQKLAFLDLNAAHTNWEMELRRLTQLRKLGIIGLKFKEGKALCSVIDGMEHLQALNIFSETKNERIDLGNLESPPQTLERLYLSGPLYSFPTWIHQLYGLVKLRLRWSNLYDDPLKTLQLLPNLVELQLLQAYIGEYLIISIHGFQKLKILQLLDLHPLKSLSIARGALPLLDEFSIGESKNLQVPCGIKYLSSLTKLNFYNMPQHFTNAILQGRQYHSIVKHVPSVLFYTKEFDRWQINTLS